jgi:hypothetical protein
LPSSAFETVAFSLVTADGHDIAGRRHHFFSYFPDVDARVSGDAAVAMQG